MSEVNFDWTAVVAERKIQEAMEAGEFDNLELAGKPIDLDENPFETMETRMVSRVLKNARALPEWMQMEQDIRREAEAVPRARERGLRGIRNARNAASRERAVQRLRADYRERLDLVNVLILKYNYVAPGSLQKPFRMFRIQEEMKRLEQEIAEATGPST